MIGEAGGCGVVPARHTIKAGRLGGEADGIEAVTKRWLNMIKKSSDFLILTVSHLLRPS